MKETPWSIIQGQNSVYKELLEIVGNGSPTGSVLEETIAVCVMILISVQKRHSRIRLHIFMQQNERNASRTRSPRGRSPSGRTSRWPCKDYLRGTCNNSFCEKWHPPECLFYKTKSGCRFGEKCSYAHRQVDEQLTKRSKKNDEKRAVAMLQKNDWHVNVWQPVVNRGTCHELKRGPTGRRASSEGQLGCVFQDMMVPKSILRKRTDMQKPIQRVKFTKAIARSHSNSRPKSFARIFCPGEPHERSPNAPKFEDRSLEETEWQEQGCPRNSGEAGQKCIKFKRSMKEQHSSLFRKIGAFLHQLSNLRNENLLPTPARQCI